METVTEFLDKLALQGVKLSAQAGRLNCYAPKGALTNELQDGIIRFKPQLMALFDDREKRERAQDAQPSAITPREFPLSAGQKGLYILQTLQPAMSAYNVPLCFKINADIDAAVLAKAWDHVLSQFPLLTAWIVERDGALYQRLDDACRTTIEQRAIDFGGDEELLAFLQRQAKRPFDLNRGPLARIELFRRDRQKSILLLTVHHIVFDGVSAVIVLRSLLELYQQLADGAPVRPAQPHAGYEEFVAWEEGMLASAEGAAHARYWQQQLDGDPPAVELLPDVPRAAAASLDGDTLVEDLPEDLSRWVRAFSKAHALPSSVIFLGVFQFLLHRFTNEDDVIVGMPVMGRAAQRFASEVGYFINMVPLRAHCAGPIQLLDFLRKVQGTTLDALYHSSYPFPLMLEGLKSGRRDKSPIFRISYAYQNFVSPTDFLSLLQQQTFQLESVTGVWQEGDFDLGLEIYEAQSTSFNLHLKYNPALYARDTIAGFLEHYFVLLRAISENPGLAVHEYGLLTGHETQKLLVEFNATAAEYPRHQCLHELFAEQVQHCPEDTAVVSGDERLTYRQLHERSHDLALYLQSLGVEPDGLVALCIGRSLDVVVAMLAIMQAGGAYVPLDPDDPAERLAYMVRDSGASLVLTEETLQDRLRAALPAETRLVAIDRQQAEIAKRVAELKARNVAFQTEVRPHHLAYVIYTSGFAGEPQGVAVEHHSAVALAHWAATVKEREALSVVPARTSICSDVSVYEILVTLANGGTVQLEPASMHEHDDARAYGNTETTIYSMHLPGEEQGPATMGRPIANTQIYLLDAHHHPQPIGAPGEVYVAGEGVARGYLNRPELTRERFVPNPFVPGTRMFKTGDRARWIDDRRIQFLGRNDSRVRIGGVRVELGEIEAQLARHPRVQEATVIAHGHGSRPQLIAFYRAKDTTADHVVQLPPEELRTYLARTLPAFMVPSLFVSRTEIALNAQGKPDRAALVDVVLKQQRVYWQDKLAGVPETLELGADFPRPAAPVVSDASHAFLLDAQLTAQLKQLAERKGVTLLMILLAAVKVLLHRYTDTTDICVGTPIASNMDGTLALRSRIDGEDTFSAFVSQVKVTCLEAFQNQDVPFEEMVDILRPYSDRTSPLFPIVVGLQHQASKPGQSDLTATFIETSAGLAGSLAYSTALYKPQTIARMAGHFVALCRSIAATPTARIRTLTFLGEAERHQVVVEFNDSHPVHVAGKLVPSLFAERARLSPDATAVMAGEAKLRYRELDEKSRALALYLQSHGVKPDDVVGICMERSLEMMVGIMGVVQAGAAYLPVDPAAPDGALAYMLQDSGARFVLTQDPFKHRLRSLLARDAQLLALDTQWLEIHKSAASGTAPRQDVQPDHAASVTYPSGSAGKPRGILIEHHALASRIAWMQNRDALDQHDVVLQATPYGSHAFTWELFWPLMAGASIVFAAPGSHDDVRSLANQIDDAGVTTLHLTPSMLQAFLDDSGVTCSSVARIFCSGDPLDRASADGYKTRFPNASLHYFYGPAETAFPVTAYDCSDLSRVFVPIGKPAGGTHVYILDRDGRPQPIGITGELHVAGDGLARGYLNLPRATEESFVANPFTPGTRMFKTGDLARWLDDGNLQYVRSRQVS
ncbi:MAG TPA: amino acid adenylation domain-containing protein [Thermoanaerobaculia bacterium]|jgi:amino acid adenylation domain-containing protein